ncbi:MAG TPA: succinate dehydrogenase, hydrophobic membrane anchor protein [Methylophilaceae bacterium]|nr:succinate dehydrogenase, hydrophobic membrane anchor protein [Methylophilaceae bacterium]
MLVVTRFLKAACHCVHHASYEWLLQRFTAVVMAIYTLLLAGVLLACRPSGYEAWQALFDATWLKVATLLFLFSLYIHAWQGVRDIIVDYIYPHAIGKVLNLAVTIALVAYAAWSVMILWK